MSLKTFIVIIVLLFLGLFVAYVMAIYGQENRIGLASPFGRGV